MVPRMEPVSTQLTMNNNCTITSRFARNIRHQLTAETLLSHIIFKNNWNRVIPRYVVWDAFSRMNKLQENQSPTYTKHIHHCLPVNHFLHQINERPSPICSCCNLEDETQDHLPWCSGVIEWRNSFFLELDKLERQLGLDLEVLQIIQQGLSQTSASSSLELTQYPVKFREAICQQNRIGWGN